MRLGLKTIAREMGLTKWQARKALRKVAWAYPPEGDPPTYDPRAVDLLQALRGLPHRPLEPVHRDWLTRYQKEHHDQPHPRPPQP